MKKQKIAFDFDRVFVDYPPIVPTYIIDFMYKKHNRKLSYRIPGLIERQIRILSHHPLLRAPIKKNIEALEELSKNQDLETFIVSSRFSFLKKRTNDWNRKHKISKYFHKMFFNYRDEQPHFFKEKVLRAEKIDKFIDDDIELLLYLSKRNPDISFYWITNKHPRNKLPANIKRIKDVNEFGKKYLEE